MNRWNPPSFDPPVLPVSSVSDSAGPATVQQLQGIQAKAYQESFARGLQEGIEAGRTQGLAIGRQEGYEAGHAEGLQAGFQKAYQQGAEQVQHLTQSLQSLEDQFAQIGQAIEEELAELVYQTAVRLTGQEPLSAASFMQSVKDALSQLPARDSPVVLRIPVDEWSTWTQLSQQAPAGLVFKIVPDADVVSGHAYIEWAGTRADVGAQARRALVRSALGLLSPLQE